MTAGVFIPHHFPKEAFQEMTQLVRKGGLIVFTIRHSHLHTPELGYNEELTRLQESGVMKLKDKLSWKKWEDINKEIDYKIFQEEIAYVYCFEVLI